MNGKIILAVLPVLAILTEENKQGPASELIPETYIYFILRSPLIRKVFQETGREK
jgi:hypothetical protein